MYALSIHPSSVQVLMNHGTHVIHNAGTALKQIAELRQEVRGRTWSVHHGVGVSLLAVNV